MSSRPIALIYALLLATLAVSWQIRSAAALRNFRQQTVLEPPVFNERGVTSNTFTNAIAGNTILVGNISDDTAATDGGAVYVFARSGSIWSHEQTLTAADASARASFGSAIAIEKIPASSTAPGAPMCSNAPAATGGRSPT